MKKELFYIYTTPILIILLVFFWNSMPMSISAYATAADGKPVVKTESIATLAQGIDVQNAEEGTLVISLAMPLDRIQSKPFDKVLLFDSAYMEGLKLIYDVNGGYLIGGVPQMYSSKINIFDGGMHKIAYVYEKKRNHQMILVDNNPVAVGRFTGQKATPNALTTAFVGYKSGSYLLDGANGVFIPKAIP